MRNIQVLKDYFLGKDPQLKETMADNSLRLIGIPGKYFVLRTELLARLKEIRKDFTDKDDELQAAIDGLIDDLSGVKNRVGSLETWRNTGEFVYEDDLAQALSDYYTKEQVDELLSVIPRFNIEVVEELPTEDISETTIYLVPSQDPQSTNSYDEFIYIDDEWEQVGSTAIDMSDYYTKQEVDTKLTFKYLTEDLVIPVHDLPDLETGWYNTGEYGIYYGDTIEPFTLPNELFYYDDDPEGPRFEFLPGGLDAQGMLRAYAWYDVDGHEWHTEGYWTTYNVNGSSTDYEIPTAAAVNTAIAANGFGFKPLTAATIRIKDLANGAYYMESNTDIYYDNNNFINDCNGYLFVWKYTGSNATTFTLIGNIQGGVKTIASGYDYTTGSCHINSLERTFETTNNKVTSLSSASTDTQYPSAKCVYDALDGKQATLTAGSNISITTANNATTISATDTTYTSEPAASGGTDVSLVTTGEKYDWNSKQDALTAGSNISITTSNNTTTISATDTTYSAFTGTDGSVAGTSGLVPAPAAADDGKYLCADGTWSTVQAGATITYGTADLTPRNIATSRWCVLLRVRIGGGIDG